jgi:hypothetical protein
MGYTFSPVPGTQDWRVQADDDVRRELEQQYQRAYNDRLGTVTKDLWGRLHSCLTHMSDRLTDGDEGKRKIFRDSLLTNAVDLCGLLTRLNVMNDPALEIARKHLEGTLVGLDAKDLRKDESARKEIKASVDAILSRFEW